MFFMFAGHVFETAVLVYSKSKWSWVGKNYISIFQKKIPITINDKKTFTVGTNTVSTRYSPTQIPIFDCLYKRK